MQHQISWVSLKINQYLERKVFYVSTSYTNKTATSVTFPTGKQIFVCRLEQGRRRGQSAARSPVPATTAPGGLGMETKRGLSHLRVHSPKCLVNTAE